MRMTQLSPNHQNQLKKFQNELNFYLAEELLTKLLKNNLITQEESNKTSELNRRNLILY